MPVNSSNRRWIFSLFVFLISGSIGWSQTDRGTITGTVTDSTGAIVPAVEVTATNLATNVPYSTLSTGTGTYRISLLPPGNYNVSSTKSGFKQTLVDNVRVAVGTTVAVDVMLQLGASRQVVNVEGGAAEQLQTTAEITTDVTPKEFETWPILLDGQQRQPTSFVFNSLPGTTGGTFQGAINGGQTFSFEAQVGGHPDRAQLPGRWDGRSHAEC